MLERCVHKDMPGARVDDQTMSGWTDVREVASRRAIWATALPPISSRACLMVPEETVLVTEICKPSAAGTR